MNRYCIRSGHVQDESTLTTVITTEGVDRKHTKKQPNEISKSALSWGCGENLQTDILPTKLGPAGTTVEATYRFIIIFITGLFLILKVFIMRNIVRCCWLMIQSHSGCLLL